MCAGPDDTRLQVSGASFAAMAAAAASETTLEPCTLAFSKWPVPDSLILGEGPSCSCLERSVLRLLATRPWRPSVKLLSDQLRLTL